MRNMLAHMKDPRKAQNHFQQPNQASSNMFQDMGHLAAPLTRQKAVSQPKPFLTGERTKRPQLKRRPLAPKNLDSLNQTLIVDGRSVQRLNVTQNLKISDLLATS